MDNLESKIKQKSIERLAALLDVDASTLSEEMSLATAVKPNPVKFWKRNQFDKILDDIRDVADKESTKLLESGDFEVKTVQDYVNFMIRCYEENPKLVLLVLGDL
ncbi:hypothetical protein [Gallaecimonas sp. GXIMD4217]|uniref:hypothetical protein n=1 Tax=Gallaecimonas sp. GXIMD4217 TaxID=3131927 RepID=UPI00311B23ED